MRKRMILSVLLIVLMIQINPILVRAQSPVPFLAQAPLAEWKDWRQQQGCEEASALMAVSWAKGETAIDPKVGRDAIVAMSDWELKKYGHYVDTSIQDTAGRLIHEYLGYDDFEVQESITVKDIAREAVAGNLVITAINGRLIGNPHYRNGGPRHHELVITGYERETDTFIFNDPGTRYGEGMRIHGPVLQKALRDYPTGNGRSNTPLPSAMIVVRR